MFRLLIILGAMLYGVLLIGGEDRGQLRIGLREAPDPEVAAPDAVAPAPEVAQASQSARPLPASIELALATLPAQPIRIGPVPASLPRAETAPAAAPAAEPETTPPPGVTLRWVAVERANVRQGASRQSAVTGRVEQGEALLVLWTEPSGWARVRTEGDGVDGFVHESLLTDTDPSR